MMPTPPDPILEVCVASIDDALAAWQAGADRLELNGALELGGLTPSLGLLREVVQCCPCPVVVMIRPRDGGFHYSKRERVVMRRDAEELLEAGAAGVAVGMLTQDRRIDVGGLAEWMRDLGPTQLVFHRAFDLVADRGAALETLIELGFCRVLTSGGEATAPQGIRELARLNRQADGRIAILAGCGITAENIGSLRRATGCREFHGSFSSEIVDDASPVSCGRLRRVNPQQVAAAKRAIA